MSNQMPKRITVTLPNPVYEKLTALASVRDKPAATLAAESVEKLVEQAVESGEIQAGKTAEGGTT
jgi:predicted transcriptional regulator